MAVNGGLEVSVIVVVMGVFAAIRQKAVEQEIREGFEV